MKQVSGFVAIVLLVALNPALAATPPTPGPGPGAPPTPEQIAAQTAERERQARLPDTPGTGRFPAMKEEVASLPDHVVYRPRSLDALGATKLGVYVFGNGGCVDDGASSRLHLLEVASHGYLVIAPGRIRTGPGTTKPMKPGAPQERTSAKDLTSALDWALAQNADPKSPYHGRIDPRALAVSGFSCGGAQAMKVAADPRWKTLVMMNSGILNVQPAVSLSDMDASKALLPTVHTPVLYTLGGDSDIAYVNGMDDFQRINHVPVFVADLKGVGHGGTYWQPDGGKVAQVVVAWLDWQLRGDQKAARLFTGKDCGLCGDSAWEVHRKGIP
jgi:hypothetical protein